MLRYHQATFDLLNITPEIDPAAVALLDALEAKPGRILPASVREWYSLKDVPPQISGNDYPVTLDELGYRLTRRVSHQVREVRLPEDLLLVVRENQSVCFWAVKLDGSDNPSVLIGDENLENWTLHALTFSDFCYTRVWDWMSTLRYWLQVYDYPFTEKTRERLQQVYEPKPVTWHYPIPSQDGGTIAYRFGNDDTHVLIWSLSDEAQSMLMASTGEGIVDAAKILFADCDLPEFEWWWPDDYDPESHELDEILTQIRDWKAKS